MSSNLREKVSSFDRILRQRANNYLKIAEKHSLRLMESLYDKNQQANTKRIDRIKTSIAQIRGDIEYGSFITLPAFRSGRRFHTETPTRIDEEISQMLFVGEVLLLECRNLFEKLQSTERLIQTNEAEALENLSKAEDSLAKLEQLQLSRSSSEGASLDSVINAYSENVDELEALANREDLFTLERSQLSGAIAMDNGSPFTRFMSAISRKPVFEKEISDSILVIGEKLRPKTGGLVKLSALYTMVKAAKPSLHITIEDVEKVVRQLEKNGAIPGLREFSGIKIVELVPVTATPDQSILLEMASEEGNVTLETVLMKTKWTHERTLRALKQLEELGITKYETTSRTWSFPAFMKDYKLEGETKNE